MEGEGQPHAALIGRSHAPGPPAVVEIGEAASDSLSVDHREGIVELFDADGVLCHAELRELCCGRLHIEVAGQPAPDPQHRGAAQHRCDGCRAYGAREESGACCVRRRGRDRREGLRLADEGVREHHCRDLRRVDRCLRLREPVGQPVDRGTVPDDEWRVELGERLRCVARGCRHRGREHDDVHARLAEEGVRAFAVCVGRQRARVDDVEVPREQFCVAARRHLAVLPEPGRHLLLEQREVARHDAYLRPGDVSQGASPPRSGRARRSRR